jgi:PAS domain S-box-containing protein
MQDAFLTADQKIHAIIDNNSYDGWLLCDFQGNLIDFNINHYKEINISKKDLIGLNICDFVDRDERESVLRFLQKVKQDGKASGIQHIKLMNGDERSYEYKDVVVYDGNEPVAVRIFVWDITDKVRNKQVPETSEARYRRVFENTGLPTVIFEENLLISMVNIRFEELSGYAKNEIEEKMSLSQFIGEEAKEKILRHFFEESGDAPSEYECRITNCKGEMFDMIVRFGNISSTRQMIASFTDITSRKQTERALKESKELLQKEVSLLWSSLKERYRFGDIIGKSQVMQEVYEIIIKAAETNANVIIYGESGTGKELVAHAIHQMSDRREQRFVAVNCGAIPENMIESEFFGCKKGAFTGAYADRLGYLDYANGGTLFLDEAGEIDSNMQVKLLRVIDGAGYIPLGSNETRKTDVRIIAATNRNLKGLIKDRSIREDFFYRIHIIPIYIPPLRERKDDLPLLIDHFRKQNDTNHPPLPGNIVDALLNYDWPGNIRELQNVLHRYFTLKRLDFARGPATRPTQMKDMLPKDGDSIRTGFNASIVSNRQTQPDWDHDKIQIAKSTMTLEAMERDHIMRALSEHNWHRDRTASALGISRKTLFRKMQKFCLLNR